MNDIYRLTLAFREAIDDALDAGEFTDDIGFQDFPNGCCGFTSELLAKYLYESGIDTWYIHGEYKFGENARPHTWLESRDGLVIDITRDQFKKNQGPLHNEEKVYVGPRDCFCKMFKIDYKVPGFDANTYKDSLVESDVEKKLNNRFGIIIKYIGDNKKKKNKIDSMV